MSTKPIPRGEVEVALGDLFRRVRTSKQVTLRALSQELGRSINTLRWHEAGARVLHFDDLSKAAELLDCDLERLFFVAPKKPLGDLELEIGNVFRRERECRNISLEEIAKALNCSITEIELHEEGRRPLRSNDLVKAADFMNCSPQRLLPINAAE